jgi:hypothetical protein
MTHSSNGARRDEDNERTSGMEFPMKRYILDLVAVGSLIVLAMTIIGPVGAQNPKRPSEAASCNIKEKVKLLETDTSNVFGPSLYIGQAKRQLKEFNRTILAMPERDGVLPKNNPTEAQRLLAHFKSYADIDSDLAEFDELLRGVVIANDPFCRKCVLKSVYVNFTALGYLVMSEDWLSGLRTHKDFSKFKLKMTIYKQIKDSAGENSEEAQSWKIGILNLLDDISLSQTFDQPMKWDTRARQMHDNLAAQRFSEGLRQLTETQCPE